MQKEELDLDCTTGRKIQIESFNNGLLVTFEGDSYGGNGKYIYTNTNNFLFDLFAHLGLLDPCVDKVAFKIKYGRSSS